MVVVVLPSPWGVGPVRAGREFVHRHLGDEVAVGKNAIGVEAQFLGDGRDPARRNTEGRRGSVRHRLRPWIPVPDLGGKSETAIAAPSDALPGLSPLWGDRTGAVRSGAGRPRTR